MKIVVSGGAGVLGSRLVRALAERGHGVRVLTLPNDPGAARLADVPCEILFCDVADAASLGGAFEGADLVYHLAAVILTRDPADYRRINVEGTRHMIDGAAAAGARHFVHVSSAAASWPGGSAYARSKADAEAIVKGQSAMAWTIVRPTLIYERDGGQEFMLFLDSLRRLPVVPFIGSGAARKSPVLADDVVRGLLAIAGNERTYEKTYDFCGGETVSMRDLARLMLEVQGLKKPFVPLPVFLCRAAAWLMERAMARPPLTRYAISRILHDAAPGCDAARRDLGYDPVGVTEGLRQCFGPHGGPVQRQ